MCTQGSPRNGVTIVSYLPSGYWELNLGPLQELLTTDSYSSLSVPLQILFTWKKRRKGVKRSVFIIELFLCPHCIEVNLSCSVI